MKKVLFHPDASEEMTASAEWYERKQGDLGKRFLAAVQDAVLRVQIKPSLYPEVMPGIRRSITRSFPFGVVYSSSDNAIFGPACNEVLHPGITPAFLLKVIVTPKHAVTITKTTTQTQK